MIHKKIICDRCERVIFDSEQKTEDKVSDIVNSLFGNSPGQDIGYAEMNVIRIDGAITHTVHLCEKCYDMAVKALNSKE